MYATIKEIVRQLRRPRAPRVRTCKIGVYDVFLRGGGCFRLSLLAQDTIARAGIDLRKPHGWDYDKQTGMFTFVQINGGNP